MVKTYSKLEKSDKFTIKLLCPGIPEKRDTPMYNLLTVP